MSFFHAAACTPIIVKRIWKKDNRRIIYSEKNNAFGTIYPELDSYFFLLQLDWISLV